MHRALALLHASTSLQLGGTSPHLHAAPTTRARPELMMLRLRILNRDLSHAMSAGSGASASMADPAAAPPPRSSTTPALPPPPPLLHAVGAAATAATVAAPPGLRAWQLSPPKSLPSAELRRSRLQLRRAGRGRPTRAGEAPARPVGRCVRSRGYARTASVTRCAHRVHKVR